ncbi:MAG TPA: prolyl oligopeptidase family serine peptidase [Anaerolineales bacterium]
MSRWIKASLLVVLLLTIVPAMPVFAQSDADCQFFGLQSSGAKYCITLPPPPPYGSWNGGLVIFAHGYVAVNEPLDIPWSQMTFNNGAGGTITLPVIVNSMGYAFATTSYSVNGLAVKQGIADILDLVNVFTQKTGLTPQRIYLVGASEGGLVTTLAVERHPEVFTGGLALCGPIGSFVGQVNYWGDFRVVTDYFMDTPDFNLLPGTAVNIPQSLMAKWNSIYIPRIEGALAANPLNTRQLFAVTHAAFDPANPLTVGETALGILWYNVFATEDGIDKLGGQPYDNQDRVYSGSLDDAALNAGVMRFKAKPAALQEIVANYETSGALARPLVTMHTTGDPIIPVWQQSLYSAKVGTNPLYVAIPPIPRYGHCSFTLGETETAFGTLIVMTGGIAPVSPLLPVSGGSAYMLGQ